MRYPVIGYHLPQSLSTRLFGDRKRYGTVIQYEDACWMEWERIYYRFYTSTQRRSVGNTVNNAGYSIVSKTDISNKHVLEIGPGDINHIDYWNGAPQSYMLADVSEIMLERAEYKLKQKGVAYATVLLDREGSRRLPFDDNTFDIILSFYSLEHLCPLTDHLDDMIRILKPKGLLVGGIPCEGGVAWGLGRFLTSRAWLKKNTTINPDKIICWEHPNFADTILRCLDTKMIKRHLHFWPWRIPVIDANLIIKFVYEKR